MDDSKNKELSVPFLALCRIVCTMLLTLDEPAKQRIKASLSLSVDLGDSQGVEAESRRVALRIVSSTLEESGGGEPNNIFHLISGGKRDD